MTRKFEVGFTVETDDRGFVPHRVFYTRPATRNRQKAVAPEGDTVYFVPADATVTEVTEMKEGYYFRKSTSELFRRDENGNWTFWSIRGSVWKPTASFVSDSDARLENLDYLGNGDGS